MPSQAQQFLSQPEPAIAQIDQPATLPELVPWLSARYPQSFEGWVWLALAIGICWAGAKLLQAIDELREG